MAALLAEAVRAVEGAAQAKDVVCHGAVVQEEESHRLLYGDCRRRGHFRNGPEVARQSGTNLQV